MIYHVKGILIEILPDSVILDINGIGYQVIIPGSYQQHLPKLGNTLKLFTYYHVREDQQTLFGFMSVQEKECFNKLTSVSGVGPKVAVKILSELSIHELSSAIFSNNINTLVSISGVGKKMAERLIIELKDKLDMIETAPSSVSSLPNSAYLDDLSLALKTLGYSKEETKSLISKAGNQLSETDPIETSIKTVLKQI
ncbi:Holliday junction branch migration protein RuvA [bacterium]|nr:Holliday junction branch migration protein RuvA [bacterium]